MMSSMHRKALIFIVLLGSGAAVGAALVQKGPTNLKFAAAQTGNYARPPVQPQPAYRAPAYQAPSPRVSSALAQWNSLRQSDGLPFSSYASFLRTYRGWPGETGLRRSAERAINDSSSPSDIISYFQVHPPLTAGGHARHAFALMATGRTAESRDAARRAWHGGVLPPADESRLLGSFGTTLTPADHDRRMEVLLANRDSTSAMRTLTLATPQRRAVYETRLALQRKAPDAASRLGAIGSAASSDPGVLQDRANWLREGGQSIAARSLLAQPRRLSSYPANVEKWYETLLTMARAAASDRNWTVAYAIASQIDDAYPAGTDITAQSLGERDDYTSLAWLAGTTALDRLNRPAEAEAMFVKYANGGRSAQVTTKGYYWAGRAALAAGRAAQANQHFERAGAHPELFYAQLALERLGRAVPAPPVPVAPTPAERAAFEQRDLVSATRMLGQMGRWSDQSVFVRALSEQVDNPRDRALAANLGPQIGRPDLSVWVGRSARNDGEPFYAQSTFPQVSIPPAQSRYWSLAHGIIRQESSFDRAAVSHANAYGMMQLLRGTAQEEASKIGLPYSAGRLTSDPNYNVTLGSSYFARLMDQWGGNAVLAAASYNAGAGNVRKWVRANGDPRLPGADIVRWIEDIPYTETRGYVQRVLENAVVYDAMNPARARGNERTRLSGYLGKSTRPG